MLFASDLDCDACGCCASGNPRCPNLVVMLKEERLKPFRDIALMEHFGRMYSRRAKAAISGLAGLPTNAEPPRRSLTLTNEPGTRDLS